MIPERRTLEQQKQDFKQQKLLAMPLAGLIAWVITGITGIFFPVEIAVWTLFIATGSIVYLGIGISKFTGEDFLDKNKPPNTFDRLFFLSVGQSILVYAIAIPFFLADYTSLPLTVGILTGTMWLPLSWIIDHWIGVFHAIVRTVCVLAAWYLFPDQRFIVIPFVIAAVYVFTIFVLNSRPRDRPESCF